MNNKENKQEQQFKQMIHDYLMENMEEFKYDSKGKDNSFVFLENRTLLTIINYIFMQSNTRYDDDKKMEYESSDMDEIIATLDSMIGDNKKEFEEIIQILNDKIGGDF